MSKYILIGLKKTCLGVLEREDRGKENETGLKEGGGREMPTTVLPLRDARSLRFEYLQYQHYLSSLPSLRSLRVLRFLR